MFNIYSKLKNIAINEFDEIVLNANILQTGKTSATLKLRIIFKDSTFLDVWLSPTGKYSYHWEAMGQKGIIYRHDNAPDHPEISTFPKHLHEKEETNIKESNLSNNPEIAIREVLSSVKKFR